MFGGVVMSNRKSSGNNEHNFSSLQLFVKKTFDIFSKIKTFWYKLPFTGSEPLWDGEGETSSVPRTGLSFFVSLVSFIAYGVFGGYIIFSYGQYLCWWVISKFYRLSVLEGRLVLTPLSVVVDIFLMLCTGISYCVFAGLVYFVLKVIFFRSKDNNGVDTLQFSFMMSIICFVIVVIVCLLVPGNFFAK